MTGEFHECFVFESSFEGSWDKDVVEESDEGRSFLLRRGRRTTYSVCGNAAIVECREIDYRSLVSCNFL